MYTSLPVQWHSNLAPSSVCSKRLVTQNATAANTPTIPTTPATPPFTAPVRTAAFALLDELLTLAGPGRSFGALEELLLAGALFVWWRRRCAQRRPPSAQFRQPSPPPLVATPYSPESEKQAFVPSTLGSGPIAQRLYVSRVSLIHEERG